MTRSSTVLLVMDFQRSIVERLGNPAVVEAATTAIEAARQHDIPVFFIRVAFRDGYPEISDSNLTFSGIAARAAGMASTDEATQIEPALGRRDSEPIVTKLRVSAFAGSDLEVLLRAAKAETLVLAGISTSGVVLSTLRQAADLDYRLVVLEDACADGDDEVHRVLTQKVFPRQATVTTTTDWVASFG